MKVKTRKEFRQRRHYRVRGKIGGTAERPRMCVFRSNRHLYVQFVDDEQAVTLASVSTLTGEGRDAGKGVEMAKKLGAAAAEQAKAKGIKSVVFDRGGFRFHGNVKAVADGAREAGLEF